MPQCNVMFINILLHSLFFFFPFSTLAPSFATSSCQTKVSHSINTSLCQHVAPSFLSTAASHLLHPLTSCDCSFIVSSHFGNTQLDSFITFKWFSIHHSFQWLEEVLCTTNYLFVILLMQFPSLSLTACIAISFLLTRTLL